VLNPHPPSPKNNVGVEVDQTKKKNGRNNKTHAFPTLFFGGGVGWDSQSDQKRVRQQSEVKYVAGWIDF
jgi:hypothetical protein